MCGICGILSTASDPKVSMRVESMNSAMVHRGPDDFGQASLGPLTMAMRRLSIIDLSPRGRQPMANEDETVWIVFNGEIYNFQEERTWLEQKGHVFRSRTDTEVIVHLYEELGQECVHRLRGMFAFAIWDCRSEELFLARDRLGIKPLYYAELPDVLIFASEIKAILASGLLRPELNLIALDYYLTFGCVPAPDTLIDRIQALPPGHAIRVKNGHLVAYRYWDLPKEGIVNCDDKEVIPRVRDLLQESIRLHQVSDVPLGAFLSGGIDSTAVVGLMSRLLNEPVRTFSVGFLDVAKRFDELEYARQVADAFGTKHTEVIIDGSKVVNELNNIVWHLDQPSGDGVNSYFVSLAASQGGLKVALSGLGADELFGGYGTYDFIPKWGGIARAWGRVPLPVRGLLGQLLGFISQTGRTRGRLHKLGRLNYVDSPLTLYLLARALLWPEERRRIYNVELLRELCLPSDDTALLEQYLGSEDSLWQVVSRLEMRNYMGHRLLRDTDVMSMAHSLEVRVPLIDHKLVEFVTGLPYQWHRNRAVPKSLMTAALENLLPKRIAHRPKHGFEFPMAHWMRNELREVIEDIFSPRVVRQRGLFNPSPLQELYRSFLSGNQEYMTVWQFVVLELWMRRYIDNPILTT